MTVHTVIRKIPFLFRSQNMPGKVSCLMFTVCILPAESNAIISVAVTLGDFLMVLGHVYVMLSTLLQL